MTFKSWTKILPYFLVEWIAKMFNPEGTIEIQNKKFKIWLFNGYSGMITSEEKYQKERISKNKRAEIKYQKKKDKAFMKFLEIKQKYPEVVRPYLKEEDYYD